MNSTAALFPSTAVDAALLSRLRMCALSLLMLGCLVTTHHAHAVQWKWIDAQGKVQYSDRPPPSDVPDKNILKRPANRLPPTGAKGLASNAAALSAPSAKPDSTEPELEKKRREAEAAETAKQKAEEEKRAQAKADNCQKARKYERALEQGYRVSRVNDKGEREFLDEKALAAEKANARRVMSSDCQ